MGMLSSLYRYATIVYVGGGFGADGIHNVLEAAVYGKPIVIGPIYDKFLEAVELIAQKGLVSVTSAIELEEKLRLLLNDGDISARTGAKAQHFTRSGGGAAERVIQIIQENRLLIR
jgi:3-deoxy-D-manno-octulosonic-acid transferase